MKPHRVSGTDNLKVAISSIVFSVFALSLADALIKQISAAFSLWQIFVVRSAIALPVLIVILKARPAPVSFRSLTPGWTALRSLMLTVMWVAYYTSLTEVELSVAAAVFYTLPLFITLFAALLLGEPVGVQGWLAVALGFCGMVLILKPQADDFNAYALLPLSSAVLYALAMILTRSKCKAEAPELLSLALILSFIVVGAPVSAMIWLWSPSQAVVETAPFLLGGWSPMGLREWLSGGLLASAIIIGSLFAAIAYQRGPSSVVGIFDFAYLPFAVLWGLLFFAERPDGATMIGMTAILIAGILAVRR